MWRYNITSNHWAYMGGSKYIQDAGIYVKNASNAWPSAREHASYWTHNGAFWLFGGTGEGQLGIFRIHFWGNF